ncbi:ABC transporter substrate-binding protein [Paenibacillus beijingensis]|uniref:Fe/B12 periplasmic-binding domain-containing protein n=1 Tax=Paenibacillus beijingensis TaxID=1126833 RepID=A0A0D5NNF9_9BACL|nr:ABC transporter substrate-binding protein [Paenibacillus beijingensis]AJY76806.1 hypothetical protein VN24_22360 [Paenibacillus beijingensis]
MKMKQNGKKLSFYLLLCLTLLLSACSGTSNKQEEPAAQSTNSSSANKEPLVQQHKYGETIVPENPQRIVSIALDDMLLSLDLPIVYASTWGENHYLANKLKEKNVEVDNVLDNIINFERILAAAPDLIIAADWIEQADYDKLSKIAPTLLFVRDEWQLEIVKIAQYTNKEEQAQTVLEANLKQAEQAREMIKQASKENATVAFLRTNDKTAFLWFPFPKESAEKNYIDVLYNELGMEPDRLTGELMKQNPNEQYGVELSLEKLPEIDADYLFVTAGSSGKSEESNKKMLDRLAEIEKLKVWQEIPAVKNGHVYKVSARHWMTNGPYADEMKINDVVQSLTK